MNHEFSFTDLTFRVDELEMELSETKKQLSSKSKELKILQKELCESREDAHSLLDEKEKNFNVLSRDKSEIYEELRYLRLQKEDLLNENLTLRNDLNSASCQLESAEKLKSSVQAMMQDIVSLNQRLDQKEKEISSKDYEIKILNHTYEEAKQAYEQLKEYHRKKDNSLNYSFCDTSIDSTLRRNSNPNMFSFNEPIESLADSLLPTYQREAEELKKTVSELEISKTLLENDLLNSNKKLEDTLDHNKKLLFDLEQKDISYKTIMTSFEEKKITLDHLEKKLKYLEKEAQDANQNCIKIKTQLEDMNNKKDSLTYNLEQKSNSYDLLEKMYEENKLMLKEQNNAVLHLKTINLELEKHSEIQKSRIEIAEQTSSDFHKKLKDLTKENDFFVNAHQQTVKQLEENKSLFNELQENIQKYKIDNEILEKKVLLSKEIICEKDDKIKILHNEIEVLKVHSAKKDEEIFNIMTKLDYLEKENKTFQARMFILEEAEKNLLKEKADLLLRIDKDKESFDFQFQKFNEENILNAKTLQKISEDKEVEISNLKCLNKNLEMKNITLEKVEKELSCEKNDLISKNAKEKENFDLEISNIQKEFNLKVESIEKQLEDKKIEKQHLETINKQLNTVIMKLEDEKRIMKHDIEDLKSQSRQKDCQMDRMSEMESTNLENFKSQEYTLKMEIETLVDNLKKVNNELEIKESEKIILQGKVEKYRGYVTLMGKKIEEQKVELNNMEEEMTKREQNFITLQKDYEFLQINNRLTKTNFGELVMEVEELKSRNQNLQGHLINITEKNKRHPTSELAFASLTRHEADFPSTQFQCSNVPLLKERRNPTDNIPPVRPPPRLLSKAESRALETSENNHYEVIYVSNSNSNSQHYSNDSGNSVCYESGQHKKSNDCLDNSNLNRISYDTTSESLNSKLSSNQNSSCGITLPSQRQDNHSTVKIHKNFAIADEEGQFMEGSSLICSENERIHELNRRNSMLPPHLRASYAPEFQDRGLAEPRRQTMILGTIPNRTDFRKINPESTISSYGDNANKKKNFVSSNVRITKNIVTEKETDIENFKPIAPASLNVTEVKSILESNGNSLDSGKSISISNGSFNLNNKEGDLKRGFDQFSMNDEVSSYSFRPTSPKLRQRKGFKSHYQKLTPSKILGRKVDNKMKKIDRNIQKEK